MGNPAKAAAQDAEGSEGKVDEEVAGADEGHEDNAEPTFADKVNTVLDGMTRDAKTGKYILPDDLSEELKFAAIAEQRRRDTQSAFTKTTQTNKALNAEKAALLKKVAGNVKVELTATQAEELEALKFSDPDAWRAKMNGYEADARTKQTQSLEEELKQVSASSLDREELGRRKQVLTEFASEHPDVAIDDDVIASDIPPRIVKRLETGEISFEAFLEECYNFLKTGKVVKQDGVRKQPNLSKVGGGTRPDANAQKEDAIVSYNKEIF